MSQLKGQKSRSLEGQIRCFSFLSLIIKYFSVRFSPFGLLQNDKVEKLNGQPSLVIGSLGRVKAELS